MDVELIGLDAWIESVEARIVESAKANGTTHSVTGEHTMGRIMN